MIDAITIAENITQVTITVMELTHATSITTTASPQITINVAEVGQKGDSGVQDPNAIIDGGIIF